MANNVVENINEIDEFLAISEDFKDDDLDVALGYVVQLIHTPEIVPHLAPRAIIRLQALGAKFAVLATYYTSIDPGKPGTENNKKKHVYYTLSKSMNDLVAAVKYLAKPF